MRSVSVFGRSMSRSTRWPRYSIIPVIIFASTYYTYFHYIAFRQMYETWATFPEYAKVNWAQHVYNKYNPGYEFVHRYVNEYIGGHLYQNASAPWEIPELSQAAWKFPDEEPTTLLGIYVLIKTAGFDRRAFLRDHSALRLMPAEDRHLVKFTFVIGRSPDPAVEKRIDQEQSIHNDLLRLDGLVGGDNMDSGKTIQWLRRIGKENPSAKWIIKCDDDTLPLLNNIVPYLKKQNWKQPTYFGTTLPRDYRLVPYMAGPMYGFSWSVVATVAAAPLRPETIERFYYEDAYTGELMLSLPPKPNSRPKPPKKQWTTLVPAGYDHRTGLRWLDVGPRICHAPERWCSDTDEAFAFHPLKSDESYGNLWSSLPHYS